MAGRLFSGQPMVGIAMGNAAIQVKEIADDITLSNDQNGVAEA